MEKLLIKPATTVLFEKKENLPKYLPSLGNHFVLITDTNVKNAFQDVIETILTNAGLSVSTIVIEPGERKKNRETKEEIENILLKNHLGRDTCLIAFGGGVILDLVGFVAATYARGIPLVSIPTTLLGMVDASIGGKTGVNTEKGKNLIGSYYFPTYILIDFSFLDTLPEKEKKNGYAEIIKYGLIADCSLFHKIETMPIQEVILKSIKIKKRIIEKDPRETGLRRSLNFGHTIGHAIEKFLHYEIAHGEAVGFGMLFASFLSCKLGFLSEEEYLKIASLLQRFGFSTHLPKMSYSDLQEALLLDKKSLQKTPRFVLLDKIGHVHPFDGLYCTPIEPSLLQEAYAHFSH